MGRPFKMQKQFLYKRETGHGDLETLQIPTRKSAWKLRKAKENINKRKDVFVEQICKRLVDCGFS